MKPLWMTVFTRNCLFALALATISMTTIRSASAQSDLTQSDVTTSGGRIHSVPLWATHTDIQNSAIAQTSAGATALVGVGTTAPVSRLHVSGSDSEPNGTFAAIEISDTASTNDKDWWLRVGAPGTNTPDGGFSLGDDDAYWMVITFNGNVGLGLNVKNPVHPLQMADGANEDGGTWNNASDRNLKENFSAIDANQLLTKISAMSIETWNYKSEGKSVRHLGPVAQDFYASFGLGQDDKHISTVDEGGVALAAIQELYRMVQKGETEVADLARSNRQKDIQIQSLTAEVNQLQQLEQTVQVLSTKLSKIEAEGDTSPNILRASR
jgi:Chaperone of endosialidase